MRWLVLWATLLVAAPASAEFSFVASTDSDNGAVFRATNARVAWLDADLNGQPGHTTPQEPIYMDVDGSGTISYGDLRLTPYGRFPAGSAVGVSDGDLGLALHGTKAWFASTTGGEWLIDMDQNVRASVGDLRVQGSQAGTRLAAGDPGLDQALTRQQLQVSESVRVGWSDPNGNGVVDPGESIYLDLVKQTGSRTVIETGDVRLTSASFDPDGAGSDPPADTPTGGESAPPSDSPPSGGPADREARPDGFTRILSIVNLVGLVALAAWLVTKHRN